MTNACVTANAIELWSDARDIVAGFTFGKQWLCIPFTGETTYFINITPSKIKYYVQAI